MPLKVGNSTVQKYIFDCGKKHTVTKYSFNNKPVWTSGGNEYDENATPAEYFVFGSGNGGWSIRAKNRDNLPSEVVIPKVYEGIPVTTIDDSAFHNCSSLTSVVIGDSVTTIGKEAFEGCDSLTNITIGNSVASIGGRAFYRCSSLTSVVIPDSVTSIGDYAFENCDSLTSITIPDSVTSIGDYAFAYCSSLTIFCEATSQPSGWESDWNSTNKPVVWGYNIEELFTFTEQTDGTYSVKATDVSTLPSVVGIPFSYNGKAVTAIDENAFYSATINKVVIPEGITHIGSGAFDNCKRLLDVSLPSTLTEIGGWAFRDCTALTSIVIPIGVTTIGTWAFLRDMSLTINCEAASQPSGWHTDWNVSGGTVVWGYTG